MDERTDPSAAFGLRLAADLLSALVVTETLSKKAATVLVDESLKSVLASHPEYEQSLREIAATLTAQVELVAIGTEREWRRQDGD